jgi:translation initiation factor 3 subunit D
MATPAAFPIPLVHINAAGWGPTEAPEQFKDLPYAAFGKGDRIGKAADFTAGDNQRRWRDRQWNRRGKGEGEANEDFQYKFDGAEEQTFELVDTAKTFKPRYPGRRPWNNMRRRNDKMFDKSGGASKAGARQNAQSTQNRRFKKLNQARWESGRAAYRRREERGRIERQSSVKVQADWEVLEQYDLGSLQKLTAKEPTVEDIIRAGHLEEYDNKYDTCSVRKNIPLKRSEDKEFYYVTTADDPYIQKFATSGAANVFATDMILAHLMSCARSVFPWDIVVTKIGDKLFFDKRDNSQFDYLTVCETSSEIPDEGGDDNINSQNMLTVEATMINQNFSQQVLKPPSSKTKRFEQPNPFFDEQDGGSPAAVGYRYRRWQLSEDIMLLARCELHAFMTKKDSEQLVTCYALNEFDSKLCGGIEWRQKIDSQRGAVLATELKNNSCKLAKWTAQTLLAGADQMKIGYVSRKARNNRYAHEILGTQFYKPKEFASQINLSQGNMWGIMKMLIQLFRAKPEGKYVILRDPMKPIMRIYAVPMHTFEDDDEDDEEEEEESEGDEDERR